MKNLKEEIQLFLAEKLIAWAVCLAPSNDEGAQLRADVAGCACFDPLLKVGDCVRLGYDWSFVSKVQLITRLSGSTERMYLCYDRTGILREWSSNELKKVKS